MLTIKVILILKNLAILLALLLVPIIAMGLIMAGLLWLMAINPPKDGEQDVSGFRSDDEPPFFPRGN